MHAKDVHIALEMDKSEISCNTALYAQGLLFAAAQVREDRRTWPQLRLNRGPMLEWACVK